MILTKIKALSAILRARTLIVLFTATFALGSCSGALIVKKYNDAQKTQQIQLELRAKDKAIEVLRHRYEQQRKTDAEIIDRLRNREAEIREVEKIVTKEVIKYVPVDESGSCNLTRGAVGMLNAARAGRGSAELPGAPKLSYGEAAEPSSITQRAEVEAHAQCGVRYNELAARHNALIDWLEQQQKEKR